MLHELQACRLASLGLGLLRIAGKRFVLIRGRIWLCVASAVGSSAVLERKLLPARIRVPDVGWQQMLSDADGGLALVALFVGADPGQNLVDQKAVDHVKLAVIHCVDRSFERREVLDGLFADAVSFFADVLDHRYFILQVLVARASVRLVLSDSDFAFLKHVIVLGNVAIFDNWIIFLESDLLHLTGQFENFFVAQFFDEGVLLEERNYFNLLLIDCFLGFVSRIFRKFKVRILAFLLAILTCLIRLV